MLDDRISHDDAGNQGYQSSYNFQEKVPKNLKNKVSQGANLSDKELMHLYLKDRGTSRIFRIVKILMANVDQKEKWRAAGDAKYSIIKSLSSSASETASQTKSFATQHFNTSKTESKNQASKATKPQEAILVMDCLNANKSILDKIFPTIDLEKLDPTQKKALVHLLNKIDSEDDPASRSLLIKVIKHVTTGQIPASINEFDACYEGFQKLNAFRKATNPLVFAASNWKGQLESNNVIDDAFISSLKTGWSNCLDEILKRPCTQTEKLEKFILSILTESEKKGTTPFNITGEKEQMLMILLSASEESPDFLNELIVRLENQGNWLDKIAGAFLTPALFVQKLAEEIRQEASKQVIEEYKQQFDPTLNDLIDSFLQARFPDAPPKQSELPDVQHLPGLLLLFKMENDSSPLAFDALTHSENRNAFYDAFGKFIPNDHKQFSLELLNALDQMAKFGSQLIHEHAYDPKEVTSGCVKYFASQRFNKQLLAAPQNVAKLNAYLLPLVSPKKDWQAELQKETANVPESLVQEFVRILDSKGLQPRNQQEVQVLATLLFAGASIQADNDYPITAIAKGIVDFLATQRQKKEAFSAPLIEREKEIIPFCYEHLTAIEGWSSQLEGNVPATQQAFCRALIAQMNADTKLIGPINSKELKALEKLIQLGVEIASDKNNAYDTESVAAGCAAYLKKMRSERKSFAEMTSLGGLISHVNKGDLYPFCFTGLANRLLRGHPDRTKIMEMLNQSIGGKTVPLLPQGRKRLEALIQGITSEQFAQGKGVHHFAAAAKFTTILHDLRLRSIVELNESDNTTQEVLEFFNYCQHEQFEKLSNASEVIEEIQQRPLESMQTLFHVVASVLMGKDNKELATISENFNEFIDSFYKKDPAGFFLLLRNQLNKFSAQLKLTESTSVTVSINTLALIKELQSEAQNIQAAYQSNELKESHNVNSYGVLGDLVYQGITGLAAIQQERNNGTYKNEETLKEAAQGLKILEKAIINKYAVAALLSTPKTTQKAVAIGLKIGLSIQMLKLKKEIQKAEKEGRLEDKDHLTVQLKIIKSIRSNREIARLLTPLAMSLLKNHKIHEHKTTIRTLRKLLEHPEYVLTEKDKIKLSEQLATSSSVIFSEIEKNYPRLLETLTDGVFNLPKQGKEKKTTVSNPLPMPKPAKPLTQAQQANASKAIEKLATAFQEEYPLEAEDAAKAVARKKAEEAAKAQEKPASNWFGSLTQGWNQFTKAVETAAHEISDSAKKTFGDYQRNQAVRAIFLLLQKELENHPYLADHFDENQKEEVLRLVKEAAQLQANGTYSSEIIAIACRLFIENETNSERKLDIPILPRLNEKTTAEKLADYSFLADIESAINLSEHSDPLMKKRIAKLLAQTLEPSTEPLNEIGKRNILALATVMKDPDFAGGKPLGLPIVTQQFRYMLPEGLNTITALNKDEISPETLESFKLRSQRLVEQGINLSSLQAGLTNQPAKAIGLLTKPLFDNIATDRKIAAEMHQTLVVLAENIENSGHMDWIQSQMDAYLEKLGVLKAVEIDANVSMRQVTTRITEEGKALKAFMEAQRRIPTHEEAQAMGVMAPLFCNLVRKATLVKEVQNASTVSSLSPTDPIRMAVEQLPAVSEGLKYAKPFLSLVKGSSPILAGLVNNAAYPVLSLVFPFLIRRIEAKDALTPEEQNELDLLKFLSDEENLKAIISLASPLINSLLDRHDFSRYEKLIDQIIKIGDPNDKNGVHEVELMEALIDSSDIVFDEFNQHYSEVIPAFLNAVKAIQFLA